MRLTNLLLLVVVFAVLHETDSWIFGRRTWRRIKRWGKSWAIAKAGALLLGKKRDVSEFDVNKDGTIDVKELEHVLTTRDAEDFLQLADEGDDSKVTVDEFKRVVEELNKLK